jgi:hypothetical protein
MRPDRNERKKESPSENWILFSPRINSVRLLNSSPGQKQKRKPLQTGKKRRKSEKKKRKKR